MTDDPQLRSLPREWHRLMRDEWNSRTAFGKLFYPFWLAEAAFQWSVLISVVLLVELSHLVLSAGEWLETKVPSTHHDD